MVPESNTQINPQVSLEACSGPQDHTSSHSEGRLARNLHLASYIAGFFTFLNMIVQLFLASVCLVKFGIRKSTNYFNFMQELEDSTVGIVVPTFSN